MEQKVTRDILREMGKGETRTFKLASAQACDSGKTMAYQMKNILGCEFTCQTDFQNNILTITKQ